MIEEPHVNGRRCGLESSREFLVMIRWGRITARVIVNDNETARFVGQGPLDHLPHVHDRLVHRPALKALRGHHRILRIYEGHVNFFLRQTLQLGLEIGRGIPSGL